MCSCWQLVVAMSRCVRQHQTLIFTETWWIHPGSGMEPIKTMAPWTKTTASCHLLYRLTGPHNSVSRCTVRLFSTQTAAAMTVFYMLIVQSCTKISVDSLRSLNEPGLSLVCYNSGHTWKVCVCGHIFASCWPVAALAVWNLILAPQSDSASPP